MNFTVDYMNKKIASFLIRDKGMLCKGTFQRENLVMVEVRNTITRVKIKYIKREGDKCCTRVFF